MHKEENHWKFFIFSLLYSLSVILICLGFNKYFFTIDDGLTEMLGFYTQYGKIWSNGNIPFIVDSMIVGGNSMIELQRGVFSPQAIAASFIAYYFGPHVPGVFLALVNFTLITYSSIIVAKKLGLNDMFARAFATCIAIQPVFLYQLSAGWWHAANGQALAIAAIAAILTVRQKLSARNLWINFIIVICLLASGWTHGAIGYAVFVFLISCFDLYKRVSIKTIALYTSPSLLALCFAIPIYSEYIISSSLISRPSGFNNYYKFLSPMWSSLLMSFTPTFYEYMNYFGGFRIMLVPLGFSTTLLPFAILYRKSSDILKKDIIAQWLLLLIVAYFVLTQFPFQFGPLRVALRFIPFLAFALCLLTFYLLSKGENNKYPRLYLLVVSISLVLSTFTSMGESSKYIFLQVASFLLLLIIPNLMKKIKLWKVCMISLTSLFIMLIGLNSLGNGYLWFEKLHKNINKDFINTDGFILSAGTGHPSKRTINDLASSQFGIYNIKSINGYSPIGHLPLEASLPHTSTHFWFDLNQVLPHLLKKNSFNQCIAIVMRISGFAMPNVQLNNHRTQLAECGYTVIHDSNNNDVYVSLPDNKTQGWNNLPPTIVPDVKYTVVAHDNNSDTLVLDARNEKTSIIFPRLWWHGYTAEFNGKSVPVASDETGFLVKVTVPKGGQGKLKLSYFPASWYKVWVFPLISIIILFSICFLINKKCFIVTQRS